MVDDIRCPRCNRLLARRRDDGALEIKESGRTVAVVRCGEVWCSHCRKLSKYERVCNVMNPALSYEEISNLSDEHILENRSKIAKGEMVYLGDMSNIEIRYGLVNHSLHEPVKRYLGKGYVFLDGSPAFIWIYECVCCYSGHEFLWALTNNRSYLGRVCRSCGIPDDRSPLAAPPHKLSPSTGRPLPLVVSPC